jgi:DNA-binding winged helix-turn-helix (wHTH) protein/Tol biopolymer transport system component
LSISACLRMEAHNRFGAMDNGATKSAEASSSPLVTAPTRFAFGVFEVDLKTEELKRSGHRIRLQSQPLRILAALLEKPGELVTRQDLQLKIWGTDVVVDFEHALGNAIKKIRDAIGDSAESPRFVETVSRRGYRFIAPVTVFRSSVHSLPAVEIAPSSAAPLTEKGARSQHIVHTHSPQSRVQVPGWPLAAAVCALGLGIFSALRLRQNSLSPPPRLSQVTLDGGIYLQGFRSPETLSPLAVEGSRIFSSAIDQSHIILLESDLDTGMARQFNLPAEVQGPEIDDISPDGTKLLVRSHPGVELEEAEEPLWVVPTNGGSAFRVGNILSHDATWTSDGNRVLYATGNRLETVSPEDGASKLLAQVAGRAFWLRWSPDGKTLRFTIVDSRQNTTSLWELRGDEPVAHRLVFGTNVPASVCCGTWTSDGKFFVIEGTHNDNSDLWALKGNSTANARQITNGPLNYTSPAAGKNEQIFFQGVDSIAPVEEREFEPVRKEFLPRADFLQEAVRVVFSLDHQWVAWTDVPGHLWRARTDGSEKLQLTSGSLDVLNCAWSADDRELALMAKYPNHVWQVFGISQSGGELQSLLSPDAPAVGDPTFSPDGKYLAFAGLPVLMGGGGDSLPIRILDLATKRITAVPNSAGLFSPRWSPDGRYIAALTLDQQKLMLYDVAAKTWKVIATMFVSDPLWAPDGKSLYFYASVSESRPIYRISIPDLKVEDVFHPTCGHHNCVLSGISPDNRPLIRVEMTRSNIFTMDLDQN